MTTTNKALDSKKNHYLWSFFLMIFFTIAMNNDWLDSYLLWYGYIALLFISYCISFKAFYFKNTTYMKWLVSFIILGALSSIWSISTEVISEVLNSLIVCLFVLTLLQSSINYDFSIDIIFRNYFIATLVNAIYVVLNIDLSQLGQVQVGEMLLDGWNGNGIAFMAAHGVLIGSYLIKKSNNKIAKAFYLLSNVGLSFLCIYTGSRTAFIVLFSSVFFFLLASRPSKLVRNITISAIVISIVIYAVMNVEGFYRILGSRLEGLFSLFSGDGLVDSSAKLRSIYIENGKEWFAESPIVGHGINNYKILNKATTGRFTYAHNNFIEIAVDFGIIGLIWYYSIYVYLFFSLLKKVKNNIFNVFLLSAISVELISHYGTVSYYDFYTNFLLMLCFYSANNEMTFKRNPNYERRNKSASVKMV